MYPINTHAFQFNRRSMMLIGILFLALFFVMLPLEAWASEAASDLPFDEPLKKLRDAVKGPVAFTLSLMGIVAAGGMLIFGGDLTGFMRTIIFLVLAVAVVVGAGNMIEALGGDSAVVAVLDVDTSLFAPYVGKFV